MESMCIWLSVPFQHCDGIIEILKESKVKHSYGSPSDLNYMDVDNSEQAFLVILIRLPEKITRFDLLDYIWQKYDRKCTKNNTVNKWYTCNGKEEIKSTNVFVKNFKCYEKDCYRISIGNNSFNMYYSENMFYLCKE